MSDIVDVCNVSLKIVSLVHKMYFKTFGLQGILPTQIGPRILLEYGYFAHQNFNLNKRIFKWKVN